jgi:hypothetical protein
MGWCRVAQWYLVVSGGIWWYLVVRDSSWWYPVVWVGICGGMRWHLVWYLVVSGGIWWYGGRRQGFDITYPSLDRSQLFMNDTRVDDGSWIIHHPSSTEGLSADTRTHKGVEVRQTKESIRSNFV